MDTMRETRLDGWTVMRETRLDGWTVKWRMPTWGEVRGNPDTPVQDYFDSASLDDTDVEIDDIPFDVFLRLVAEVQKELFGELPLGTRSQPQDG